MVAHLKIGKYGPRNMVCIQGDMDYDKIAFQQPVLMSWWYAKIELSEMFPAG
jgi:hypothetical protein